MLGASDCGTRWKLFCSILMNLRSAVILKAKILHIFRQILLAWEEVHLISIKINEIIYFESYQNQQIRHTSIRVYSFYRHFNEALFLNIFKIMINNNT